MYLQENIAVSGKRRNEHLQFDGLFFSFGREETTRIELFKPLTESVILNWDYTSFDAKLLDLALLAEAQKLYNRRYEY